MSESIITGITTVAIAIIGVASIAVFVSKQAQTGQVVSQFGSSFAQALICAANPGGGNCGTSSTSIFSTNL